MSKLGTTIEHQEWQQAALYLLLGVAGASKPVGNPRPRRGKGVDSSFYAEALSEAERLELEEALGVEGLDQEIALLRLKLKRALEEEPENLALMVKGLELLVRAVSARYRLSQEDQEGLVEGLRAVLEDVGAKLYPEGFANG
ncbi:MAG TPA: hypothetical protein VJM69_01620 [Dehalococcoidia bacterium]|nr:hypothetical protein [Dehalococcoidia bacterium]